MRTVVEPLGPGLSRVWELTEVLADTRTPYQHVVIARTAHGITLFCDGDRQSAEASQLVYHEALLVPALLLARRPDRVLVIGSSEGVICQLAVAAGARRVDHVDIDRTAVELCAQHLPYGYSPDDLDRATHHDGPDGPIHLHYTDGARFVASSAGGYDIIVLDLPDEQPGPAQHNRLYEADFLATCRRLLTGGGVLAAQAGCPTLWRNGTLIQSWHRFRQVFPAVAYYGSDEQEWSFLFGLTDPPPDPAAHMIERLATLPAAPASIDADALRGNTVPPHSVRSATSRDAAGDPAAARDR